MLRLASRTLFVARNRALLATTRVTNTTIPQNLEQQQKQQQQQNERQRDAMRKMGATKEDATTATRFEDRYQERDDTKPSLWERAKEAAQTVKDSFAVKAEQAQERATAAKDNMSERMDEASEMAKEKYASTKETLAQRYEGAKEAVGEKLDDISDSLQNRQTDRKRAQQRQNLSRTEPLGKTYTKVDMSWKAMNEEVTLTDVEGNLSHDDEVIAHAAAKSGHSVDHMEQARSTEDLALGYLKTDTKAATQEKRRDITYGGNTDDFLEPQQQVDRKKQDFSQNISDTKKAADHTWSKAGSNFMHGLEKTAQHLEKKEAKKEATKGQTKTDTKDMKHEKIPQKDAQQLWEEGKSINQSWNEILEATEKQESKEEAPKRKGPAFGLQDLTGSDANLKKTEYKKADKEAQQKKEQQLERGKRTKKGPMYGMEDLTGPTEASTSQQTGADRDSTAQDKQNNRQQDNDTQAKNRDDDPSCTIPQKQGKNDKTTQAQGQQRTAQDQTQSSKQSNERQTDKQAKNKGQVEDKDEANMAERSNKASVSSKARGSNDVSGLANDETGDDSANENARNIAGLAKPASSTF